MKRILLISFLSCCCVLAYSQTGKIAGSVMDSATKSPLELATVTVLGQDSSVIAYQLSDKYGKFAIGKLPLRKQLLVSISYTGYINYQTALQLEAGKTDSLVVFLELNKMDTLGVVVTASIPIRMNGDTLEINPAAFKMKKEAVVEELLNQVSGITIWSDGTITVNGVKVQSLLVDGKPFMGTTDPRIATQNLPKSAIDKIQLYQEYDRSNIGQPIQPQDSLLTMNIKLKEGSKKGYFGKGGIGVGTTERFESDLSFQVYTKKSSAGVGGGINNINKNIGSLQEMFQNNTFRSSNPNLYNVGRFGGSGISRNHSIGLLATHNFNDAANSRQNNRLSVNYTKSGTNSFLTDLNLQNRTTLNNPQFVREEGEQKSRQDRHDFGFTYVKTNSYNDNLSVSGNVGSSTDRSNSSRNVEVRNAANELQSTNNSNTQQSRRSDNESVNLGFAKSDNEEPAKSFNLQVSVRRNNSRSVRDVITEFESFTDVSQNNSFNRRYISNNESLSVGGTLDYTGFKRLLLGRYNLFGINLNFSQRFNYNRFKDDTEASDYDSTNKVYVNNGDLSNRNERELIEYSPILSLSKYFSKYNDSYNRTISIQVRFINDLKTDKNSSSFAKRNLDRSFNFFRYEGNVNLTFQKRGKYRYFVSGNYSRNYDYPSIDRLYTIVDNINAYDIRIGNPFLKNTRNHSFGVNSNFNTENPKSEYSGNGNISGGYSFTLDPVTDSIINELSGKRTSYYVNAGRISTKSLNWGINIAKRIKKSSLQFTYNGNFRDSESPNYIDGVSNTSGTNNFSNQFSWQFSLRTVLIINLQQSFQRYKYQPTAPGLNAFTNNSNSTRLGLVLNYPENFSFSSTAERVNNSNIDKPFIFWNSFVTYRFMKQQGELKFSAMDILKKYQNINNGANAYGTYTRITNGLQQYFLLTFSYYPRKFGKKERTARPGRGGQTRRIAK
ncbi:MAG TPA: carboxypeptidase regulatory-like domain-containing protein [Chitinophagaceae bacterium]